MNHLSHAWGRLLWRMRLSNMARSAYIKEQIEIARTWGVSEDLIEAMLRQVLDDSNPGNRFRNLVSDEIACIKAEWKRRQFWNGPTEPGEGLDW